MNQSSTKIRVKVIVIHFIFNSWIPEFEVYLFNISLLWSEFSVKFVISWETILLFYAGIFSLSICFALIIQLGQTASATISCESIEDDD